jgi:hypothetical protein
MVVYVTVVSSSAHAEKCTRAHGPDGRGDRIAYSSDGTSSGRHWSFAHVASPGHCGPQEQELKYYFGYTEPTSGCRNPWTHLVVTLELQSPVCSVESICAGRVYGGQTLVMRIPVTAYVGCLAGFV